jgi:uncharacterized membrane protein YagU involved in acid resistance
MIATITGWPLRTKRIVIVDCGYGVVSGAGVVVGLLAGLSVGVGLWPTTVATPPRSTVEVINPATAAASMGARTLAEAARVTVSTFALVVSFISDLQIVARWVFRFSSAE